MLEKTNISGYFKDTSTNLIINKNDHEYKQYLAARMKTVELNTVNERLAKMSGEIDQLKSMIGQLLEKGITVGT